MLSRFLGRTGIRVSELALGLGNNVNQVKDTGASKEETNALFRKLLDKYAHAGGNFIDLTNGTIFGPGPESLVGDWLSKKPAALRQRMIISTKGGFAVGDGPNEVGLSRSAILRNVETSLRALKTDYIDLYYVYAPDPATSLEETLHTYNNLVEKGLVRYIACSNYSGWELQRACSLSSHKGWESFCGIQTHYSLLDRQIEDELLHCAQANGVSLLPWGALASGWLGGRYTRGMITPPRDSRLAFEEEHGASYNNFDFRRSDPKTWEVLAALEQVSKEINRPIAQIAMNWVKDQPQVASVMTGAGSIEQLESMLQSCDFSLTPEQRQSLNDASARPLTITQQMKVRMVPEDRRNRNF